MSDGLSRAAENAYGILTRTEAQQAHEDRLCELARAETREAIAADLEREANVLQGKAIRHSERNEKGSGIAFARCVDCGAYAWDLARRIRSGEIGRRDG